MPFVRLRRVKRIAEADAAQLARRMPDDAPITVDETVRLLGRIARTGPLAARLRALELLGERTGLFRSEPAAGPVLALSDDERAERIEAILERAGHVGTQRPHEVVAPGHGHGKDGERGSRRGAEARVWGCRSDSRKKVRHRQAASSLAAANAASAPAARACDHRTVVSTHGSSGGGRPSTGVLLR